MPSSLFMVTLELSRVLVGRDQCRDDRVNGRIGERDHLVIGAVLDRMGDEHPRRVEPQRAGLRVRSIDELARREKHRRNTAGFEIGDVVHTARRTAASVGEGFDDRLALLADLLA